MPTDQTERTGDAMANALLESEHVENRQLAHDWFAAREVCRVCLGPLEGADGRRYVPAADTSKETELERLDAAAKARAPRCSCGLDPDHPKQHKDCHVVPASSKEVGGE